MTAYTDFHYSPTGSGVISGSQVLEQTEQGINGLGQYVQDNISGAIDTANQALTIAQTANTNATTALNTANSFSDAITTANQTANNALTTAQSAQSTANAASSLATTANNNATSALNAANAATSNVNILTSTVNGLGNRMTAAENAISANTGNITTLQNNLATTNANVTAAANAASSAQATATSAQSTATLARNQAYVLRYTGTTITGGGTIAYTDIDNTDNIKAGDKIIDISGAIYAIASVDTANQTVIVGASPVINLFCDAENLIPAANNSYDLGSSSYQWNNLYAKNYFYNGTAWGLNKANTWTGINTFTAKTLYHVTEDPTYVLKSSTMQEGVVPSENRAAYTGNWQDKNSNVLGYDRFSFYSTARIQAYEVNLRNKATNGSFDPNGSLIQSGYQLVLYPSGNSELKIYAHNLPNGNGVWNLGDSTHKWKTLNGVNPGALSLPDLSRKSSILEYITDLTGGLQYYTPLADGWICIQADNSSATNYIRCAYDDILVKVNGNGQAQGLSVLIPVLAGVQIGIRVVCTTLSSAYFYHCQGNVT